MPPSSPAAAEVIPLSTPALEAPRSQRISLEAILSSKLHLSDPFMVASSHHTDNENSLSELGNFEPSAVTLKTISNRQGGAGAAEPRKREQVRLDYPGGNRLGRFTDGPKRTELWDAPTAFVYIQKAKHYLPAAALGISVAEGENYATISQSLDLSPVSYAELNWKYTFRDKDFATGVILMKTDLENFIRQFEPFPVLVKIPSELLPFLQRDELCEIYEFLADHHGLLLVANTKRAVVPPSRQPHIRKLYNRGVIYGEQLFLDTFNAISTLTDLKAKGVKIPSLIATGGMTDIGAIIDVIAAGAEAVQLCSILDYRKASAIDVLRRQMRKLIADSGLDNYEAFKSQLQAKDDNHKKWLTASHKAREIETSHDEIMKFMRQNKEKALKEIETTLLAETLDGDKTAARSRVRLPGRSRPTILINRANIAAFLIAHRLAGELNLRSETIDGATELRDRLGRKEFDLAIVPNRIVSEINENMGGDGATPLRNIGKVGQSVWELVGTADTLRSIRTLFYFSGTSSAEALKQLWPQILPQIERPPTIRVIEDIGHELSPILVFWDDSDTILARGPLTNFYKLFLDKESQIRWKSMSSVNDDLVLVSTARLDFTSEQTELLLKDAERISRELHADPATGARQAYQLGYLNHIANLLGANVLA